MKKTILFLSLEDILKCDGADIDKAIEDIREGFIDLHNGKILSPLKTTLKSPVQNQEHSEGLVNSLPAYVDFGNEQFFSFKMLGAMPANVEKGIPRATGLIVLFDSVNKSPVAIMDAQVISAMRTGAVSSLAGDAFLPKGIDSVTLVGAGVNMRTQLLGILKARPSIKQVKIYSRGDSKNIFAQEMSAKTGVEILPQTDCETALKEQKFMITCLPNVTVPVVKESWIRKKGMTVFNIGCYETEAQLLGRMDRVIADLWEQGKHRGAQTHAIAEKMGVISEDKIENFAPIVAGEVPGRINDDENIFFCPTGLGFEDAVLAIRIYKTAMERKVGQELTLWNDSDWI